ncbi:MAG: hypothetical protein ACE37B_21870 [Ilumatobacter sp.]|uniref:hypothetical protein n=1 Tax=Ilumatobacter sp. TaxID=1967498 RepID=UPI00391BF3A5
MADLAAFGVFTMFAATFAAAVVHSLLPHRRSTLWNAPPAPPLTRVGTAIVTDTPRPRHSEFPLDEHEGYSGRRTA